jgi:hypothetical protein
MSGTTRTWTASGGAATPAGDRRPGRPVVNAVVVLASGFALGFLTLLGQKWLHGAWLAVVNSGAVWLLPAFVAGSFMRTDATAAAAGAGLLVAAVVGYYAPVPLVVEGAAANSHSVAIWSATAVVGGPVYGLAGRWWRRGRTWRIWVALGLLGGAFLAEGAARLHAGNDGAAGWTMVAVGLALPLLLGRSARDRAFGLVTTAPVVALTAVAYTVINWAFLHS